jgi:hypothetical protein
MRRAYVHDPFSFPVLLLAKLTHMRFLFLLQYLILVISGSDISYLYATDWRPLLFLLFNLCV